jgi:hypothetical protein
MTSGLCRQATPLVIGICNAARQLILRTCCLQFGFKRNKLRTGVDAVLAYLERCRISEGAGATQPLALEVQPRLSVAVSFEPYRGALTPHLRATVAQPCKLCTQGVTQSQRSCGALKPVPVA